MSPKEWKAGKTFSRMSAGELAPSVAMRSSSPSVAKTVLTVMPVSAVKASSNGLIRPGSR